jgi:hypothetical protein
MHHSTSCLMQRCSPTKTTNVLPAAISRFVDLGT